MLLAEARIGAELKAAQERGEIAQNGRSTSVSTGNALPTTEEVGFTRKQARIAKQMAEAGSDRIRAEVERATAPTLPRP